MIPVGFLVCMQITTACHFGGSRDIPPAHGPVHVHDMNEGVKICTKTVDSRHDNSAKPNSNFGSHGLMAGKASWSDSRCRLNSHLDVSREVPQWKLGRSLNLRGPVMIDCKDGTPCGVKLDKSYHCSLHAGEFQHALDKCLVALMIFGNL